MSDTLDPKILDVLASAHLIAADDRVDAERLTGGVSSDIWRVTGSRGSICLKRALDKLKVKDDWFAPVSRNASEVAWLTTARSITPANVPEVLFHDEEHGLFVMPYFDPADYRNWKQELRQGCVDTDVSATVGQVLARIHGATANNPDIAATFANDGTFYDIRLEPYLIATARRHEAVAPRLHQLAEITASTKQALVHGDVSPKNILIGPDGPVFIDAECAWYGDPAFDLGFCLNHLLLKCIWVPDARTGLRQAFDDLLAGYTDGLSGLDPRPIRTRTAHLLAGLLLARIDGKSPVEYITDTAEKDRVRSFAIRFLQTPVDDPVELCDAWHKHMGASD